MGVREIVTFVGKFYYTNWGGYYLTVWAGGVKIHMKPDIVITSFSLIKL